MDRLLKRLTRAISPRNYLMLASMLNQSGLAMQFLSRRIMAGLYPELRNEPYFDQLADLHRRIGGELNLQTRRYPNMIYEHGYPYQALHTLGIFGVRSTESRFSEYGLDGLLKPEDRILDIGCSCGFMLICASFRTGCGGHGIDINPHMIAIGRHVASFLGLDQRVTLQASRFQDFTDAKPFSAIFSFASHWTDDGQLRPDFDSHMRRLHSLLTPAGLLLFESHCNDVGNASFYTAMEHQRRLFSWTCGKLLNNRQRELFVMRKI